MKRDPIGYARAIGVGVGADCRILGISEATFGSEPYLIELGDHVTITDSVRFVTHDGGVWVFRAEHPNINSYGAIRVGNNVFIGLGTIVLPGVTIGDNCVIGAGSVVTHDIPPGHVAAGVPAKVIRTTAEYWDRVQKRCAVTPVVRCASIGTRLPRAVPAPGAAKLPKSR